MPVRPDIKEPRTGDLHGDRREREESLRPRNPARNRLRSLRHALGCAAAVQLENTAASDAGAKIFGLLHNRLLGCNVAGAEAIRVGQLAAACADCDCGRDEGNNEESAGLGHDL